MMEGAVSQIQRHTIIRFSYLGKNRGIMWYRVYKHRLLFLFLILGKSGIDFKIFTIMELLLRHEKMI